MTAAAWRDGALDLVRDVPGYVAVDLTGVLAGAVSGALVARARGYDLVGVLGLAPTSGVGFGLRMLSLHFGWTGP